MALRLTPYLMMDGNAKEAIEFYVQALDAQLLSVQTYEDMTEDPNLAAMPADIKDRVAHALLKAGDSEFMLSDTFPGSPFQSGNQVTISITTKGVDRSKQIYEALQQGGRMNYPLEKTSFSPAFGSLTDKFGVTFTVVTEI